MKDTLNALSLSSSHCVHIGRKLGSHKLELLEIPSDEINKLAAMWVLEPERQDHHIFKVLEFTKHTQWAPFVASMKNALDAARRSQARHRGLEGCRNVPSRAD